MIPRRLLFRGTSFKGSTRSHLIDVKVQHRVELEDVVLVLLRYDELIAILLRRGIVIIRHGGFRGVHAFFPSRVCARARARNSDPPP